MFTPFQDEYLLLVPQYRYKLLKKWYAACVNDDVEIYDHLRFLFFYFNYRHSNLVTADGMVPSGNRESAAKIISHVGEI